MPCARRAAQMLFSGVHFHFMALILLTADFTINLYSYLRVQMNYLHSEAQRFSIMEF